MRYRFAIIIIVFISILIVTSSVDAISPTPAKRLTPTPTKSAQDSQIERIKDLVASKVAELKLVDKRGFLGRVKDASNSQIALLDEKGHEILIDIDELTKFNSSSTESFGISDIKKGDQISAIGLYNKETERLLARFITNATNVPENIEGVVVDLDRQNFTLTIKTSDNKKKIINIETSTKTSVYEQEELSKSGFSKIDVGERVVIVGFTDKKIADQINASRVIRLLDIALSEELNKVKESSATETPTPEPTKTKQ